MQNKILKEKIKVLNFYIPNEAKYNKTLNGEDSWQKDFCVFNRYLCIILPTLKK
jgi:hypothetical protein